MKDQIRKLYPDFTQEVDNLSSAELEARIVRMQQTLDESEMHREGNDSLKQARATLTELSGPYNDVKKAVKLKTRYIIELLKEKT